MYTALRHIMLSLAILLALAMGRSMSQSFKPMAQRYAELQTKKDTAYIDAMYELAHQYHFQNNLDSSSFYYNKGFALSEKLGYYRGMYGAKKGLGLIYLYKVKHDSAMAAFLEALQYAAKVPYKRKSYETRLKEHIATAYMLVNDTSKAGPYLREIASAVGALKDTNLMVDWRRDMTFYYGVRMDTATALKYYREALALCDEMEKKCSAAEDYLSCNQADQLRRNLFGTAIHLFSTRELYSQAIAYMERMLERLHYPGYGFVKNDILRELASMYIGIEEEDKAIEYAKMALADSNTLALDKLKLYEIVTIGYYNLDRYKEAYEYNLLYHDEYEKYYNREMFAAVTGLEAKYQAEQKERQISALKAEKRAQAIIIGFAIGAAVILLALLVFLFRARRLRKQLFTKEKELQKNELEKRMLELEQTALRAQMNPYFIFNSLDSVKRFVYNKDVEGVNQYLFTFANLIRQTLSNSGKQLIPLKDEVRYLETYLRLQQMRDNEAFSYQININPDIDPEATYIPNMILQPYLANSVTKAAASKDNKDGIVNLSISKNHKLTCVLESSGTAHSNTEVEQESAGVAITEKRIEIFNTTNDEKIELEMTAGDGERVNSRIMIKFPLNIEN